MIRTLIAEQTSLIRAGLVAFLSCSDDIEVVAELQRGDQVVPASRALLPDVAVLAAALPGADGFAAARALHAELPSCHSLIMGDQRDPAGLRRAVAAHASGFVVRDAAPDFITEAVRRVARGRKVIDPDLAFAGARAHKCDPSLFLTSAHWASFLLFACPSDPLMRSEAPDRSSSAARSRPSCLAPAVTASACARSIRLPSGLMTAACIRSRVVPAA